MKQLFLIRLKLGFPSGEGPIFCFLSSRSRDCHGIWIIAVTVYLYVLFVNMNIDFYLQKKKSYHALIFFLITEGEVFPCIGIFSTFLLHSLIT